MKRILILGRILAVVLILTAGTTGAPVRAGEGIGEIGLEDCRLTVHFLKETDGQRLQERWLPEGYDLATFPPYGPGSASLSIWAFACDGASLDGAPASPAMLSLIGIQIEDRLAHSVIPTHWDNYLVWAHTDSEALNNGLRAAGLPALLVPDMQFSYRVDGDLTTAKIPWGESPYELSVRGRVPDAPHLHDNTFQHGVGPGDGPRLELVIDPLVPRDKLCLADVHPDCMNVSTQPGSQMDSLLGTVTYVAAADHDLISHGRINVVSD